MKLELARLFQILHRFDEATERLKAIKDGDRLPAKLRRIFIDLSIQNSRRKAEYLTGNQEYLDTMKYLQEARKFYEASPITLIDEKTKYNLARAWRTVTVLKRAFIGLPEHELISDFSKWLARATSNSPQIPQSDPVTVEQDESEEVVEGNAPLEERPPSRGRLVDLRASFGFIKMGTRKLFFHKTNWMSAIDFKLLGEGTVVQFDVDGGKALNVSPVGVVPSESVMNKRFLGAVNKLHPAFGFITLDTGGEVSFAKKDCAATTRFGKLVPGERVRFNVARDEKGRLYATNVEVYSGTAT